MRKFFGLVWIIVVVCLFAGCAPSVDVPVHIDVVDTGTQEGLACTVIITSARGEGAPIERDLSGDSLTLALPADRYTVRVMAPGYHDGSDSFKAVDHRAPVVRTVDLERRQTMVRLVDAETGDRLAGVTLTYGEQAAVSDGKGQAVFHWTDTDEIVLEHPRYEPTVLALESVDEGDVVVFGQLEPNRVAGTVVDVDSGEPIAAARIVCGHQTVQGDDDGQFELARVELHETLSVSAAGYHAVANAGLAQDMVLELTALTRDVVVTDEITGLPLGQVTITTTRGEVRTDDVGTATVRVWEEDTLELSLSGYAPLAVPVSLDTPEHLSLTLAPSRLAFYLTDVTSGQPVTVATVLLYRGDEVLVREPDAQGNLVVDDVTGIERALVKAPSYRRVELPVTGHGEIDVALEPFDVRAVYIPFGALTLPDRIEGILDMVDASPELNGIVVDVKSDRARLAWPSEHPLAVEMDAHQTDIMELTELLAECERRGIYAVARMVIFKDDLLAQARPEWAVMRDTGEAYLDNEDLRWVDPFRQEVRDYNVSLALEIAAMGWDEVQFDYLRFPSDGGTKGLVYQQESVFETRTVAMAEFVAQAHDALAPTPAFFSADIFGLTVWVDPARDMGIGQRVDDIAPYVDYLSPMLYPTTFGPGNLGFDDPGSVPYEVIYHSVLKTLKRTPTPVRPWLQAYAIGSYDYGLWELLAQKKGAVDADSHGWIFWNAAGKYMPEVFQGDAYDLVEDLPEPPEG